MPQFVQATAGTRLVQNVHGTLARLQEADTHVTLVRARPCGGGVWHPKTCTAPWRKPGFSQPESAEAPADAESGTELWIAVESVYAALSLRGPRILLLRL